MKACLLLQLFCLQPLAAQAQACPPLDDYYDAVDAGQAGIAGTLRNLMPACLENTEYFALVGAALLNTGQVAESMEALERALLLDPENGAAQIDYAQALYLGQQLFPALEINTRLLARTDLPPNIRELLQQRQALWQAETTASSLQAELSLGYDNNLNGAPLSNELTLTLSGETITLPLAPSFQPQEGPYLNTRLLGSRQKLSPDALHEGYFVLRSRNSESGSTDLAQFDWRYAQTRTFRRYQWGFEAGTSHLYYGGSPLFSIYEASARIRPQGTGCKPQLSVVAQIQLYHGQSIISGLESSAAAGYECRSVNRRQIIGMSLGLLYNDARDAARPGGNRDGWRLRFYWQQQLLGGTLNTQFNLVGLDDANGYSPLLAGGAKRDVDNAILRARYSKAIYGNLIGLISFNYQNQESNIKTFSNKGVAGELGLNWQF